MPDDKYAVPVDVPAPEMPKIHPSLAASLLACLYTAANLPLSANFFLDVILAGLDPDQAAALEEAMGSDAVLNSANADAQAVNDYPEHVIRYGEIQ